MQLPAASLHYSQVVSFGNYVVRRLRRAKFSSLANDAELATQAVKSMGRAWEDAAEPIQYALADRDAVDDDLDDGAKHLRNGLAGRSLQAISQPPYSLIFHSGVAYFTAARVDDEIPRYTELQQLVTSHLPLADALRQPALDTLNQGINDYALASGALTQARIQESMAKVALDSAREGWERLMEKIYGALVSELGRKQAERFFPRQKSKAKTAPQEE